MSKEQIVSDAKVSFVTGQDQILSDVLGSVYDQAAMEQKASDGTLSQADLDKAVSDAVAPLNNQITTLTAQVGMDAQVLADAQAKAQSDLDLVNKALVDMTAKEQMEEQAVSDVKAKIDAVQASFDNIKAILFPQP